MMPNMGFNYNRNYNQEINALQNQIDQLRGLNNQIQSPISNPSQLANNGIIQIGTYVVVKSIQDMENYPVPVDGTPVNIFVDNTGAFYSKKMVNGTVSCQPFSFAPLNSVKTDDNQENKSSENMPEWAENIIDRIYALEQKLSESQKRTRKTEEVVISDGV